MYLNDLTFFYYPLPLCLRVVSLQQFPSTSDVISLAGAYRGGIAALAALFAPSVEGGEIALAALISTLVRRKLACTSARWAERQRVVGVGQIVSHPQWRRAKQCRHARHFRSPGAALLRAASRQCNFLWVGLREGYLFFKKRYPSLVSPLLWHIFPPSCPYYGRKSKREGGYGAVIGKLRGKCARAG